MEKVCRLKVPIHPDWEMYFFENKSKDITDIAMKYGLEVGMAEEGKIYIQRLIRWELKKTVNSYLYQKKRQTKPTRDKK